MVNGACRLCKTSIGELRGLEWAAQAAEQDAELVAAEARDCSGGGDGDLESLGHVAKELVTCLMAECVVHFGEVVDVDHEHRNLTAVQGTLGHRRGQELAKRAAVGKASEGVVTRLVLVSQ